MTSQEFEALLRQTLEDFMLSRKERQSLRTQLLPDRLDPEKLREYRDIAFRLASETMEAGGAGRVIVWLQDVINLLLPPTDDGQDMNCQVFFSHCDDCSLRIIRQIHCAREQIDLCVYTISDDQICRALCAAHQKGVKLRIVSDEERIEDEGSDVSRLIKAKIPVRLHVDPDRRSRMHHKFAIIDRQRVLTGSYNWTHQAARRNDENVVLSNDRGFVRKFIEEFERLWAELEG